MRKHTVQTQDLIHSPGSPHPLRSLGRRAKRKIRSEARSNVTPAGCRKISDHREIEAVNEIFATSTQNSPQNQDIDLGLRARDDITSISRGCWVKSL